MCCCDVCGANFQFGPHLYDGTYIQTYQITVCFGCFGANWDGWAPHYEEAVTRTLKAQGVPIPARNKKGLLPRE
jgi:hypothetical protein